MADLFRHPYLKPLVLKMCEGGTESPGTTTTLRMQVLDCHESGHLRLSDAWNFVDAQCTPECMAHFDGGHDSRPLFTHLRGAIVNITRFVVVLPLEWQWQASNRSNDRSIILRVDDLTFVSNDGALGCVGFHPPDRDIERIGSDPDVRKALRDRRGKWFREIVHLGRNVHRVEDIFDERMREEVQKDEQWLQSWHRIFNEIPITSQGGNVHPADGWHLDTGDVSTGLSPLVEDALEDGCSVASDVASDAASLRLRVLEEGEEEEEEEEEEESLHPWQYVQSPPEIVEDENPATPAHKRPRENDESSTTLSSEIASPLLSSRRTSSPLPAYVVPPPSCGGGGGGGVSSTDRKRKSMGMGERRTVTNPARGSPSWFKLFQNTEIHWLV